MGGKKEFKTFSKKTAVKDEDKTINGTDCELRIHESKGEVHFHDDADKLKCVVPVSTWYEMWQKLRKNVNTVLNYVDLKNNTVLNARISCSAGGTHTQVKFDIWIAPAEVEGDSLAAMVKFMEE